MSLEEVLGSAKKVEELTKTAKNSLYRNYSGTYSMQSVEDAVQNALGNLYRYGDSYNPSQPLQPYFNTIADREFLSISRQAAKKREVEVSGESTEDSPGIIAMTPTPTPAPDNIIYHQLLLDELYERFPFLVGDHAHASVEGKWTEGQYLTFFKIYRAVIKLFDQGKSVEMEALIRFYICKETCEEIAKHMSCTSGAVRVRLVRARASVREVDFAK